MKTQAYHSGPVRILLGEQFTDRLQLPPPLRTGFRVLHSSWGTDFRKDLPRIGVPTLVIHGDADRILLIAATGIRTQKAVKGNYIVG
jgi:pimeloyl-ACP methyl ester carboxylesterase